MRTQWWTADMLACRRNRFAGGGKKDWGPLHVGREAFLASKTGRPAVLNGGLSGMWWLLLVTVVCWGVAYLIDRLGGSEQDKTLETAKWGAFGVGTAFLCVFVGVTCQAD